LTGIHQRTAPTKINRTDWNDLVTFLGGTSSDPQIDATKILLAQGGSLLSTWRYASDLTKMDAAKVAGNIAAAQMQTNVLAAIIAAGGIVDADVAAGAAIAKSKLALTNSIVDADINSAAAIAKSKISTSGTWTRTELAAPHHRKAFAAYQSSSQTIAPNVVTKLTFTTEEFDLDSVFASSTYTPNEVGYYLIGGAFALLDVENGVDLEFMLYKNSALFKRLGRIYPGAASSYSQLIGSALVYASAVTDYFDLYVYHLNSVNKNTIAAQEWTFFWGFEI